MTPTVTPRHRRGASLVIGGMFLVTSTLLIGTPLANAAPSSDAVNAINDRYTTFGGEGSLLGAPIGDPVDVKGGAERDFAGGAIYYSKETGAHVMYGDILEKYRALGGPGSELGFPKNDESDSGDGVGRFNDFSEANGDAASIYWTPNVGAWVIKGKVLDAWRASGGVKGPFGYPTADTNSGPDGVLTSTFVGPDGTQIQWSKAAGLVTVPPALSGKIPGFGAATPTAEGTTSVTKTSVAAPAAPAGEKKSNKWWWWWIPIVLGLLALLGLLPRLFRRRREVVVEPVKVTTRAPEVKKVVTPPPAPRPAAAPPVKKVVAPPPPPRPAPKPPVPPVAPKAAPVAPIAPVAKTPPPPPPAPKPVTPPPPPPAPRPVERLVEKVERVVETPRIETPRVETPRVTERVEAPHIERVERVVEAPHVAERVERIVEAPHVERAERVERVEAPHVAERVERIVEAPHVERIVEAPRATLHSEFTDTKATIHTESSVDHDVTPVIRYASQTSPAETTIQVTYENNAVGDHQESRADKSDLTPDHLQD